MKIYGRKELANCGFLKKKRFFFGWKLPTGMQLDTSAWENKQ